MRKQKQAAAQDTYQDLALRFAELGKLFQKLGTPKAAQRLMEGLATGDRAVFNEFVNQLDLPIPNKCFWLGEIVPRVVCTIATRQESRVLSPMTRTQVREYVRILNLHANEILFFSDGTIVPGPFLDDLVKAGLAVTKQVRYKSCAFEPVITPPEQVCV